MWWGEQVFHYFSIGTLLFVTFLCFGVIQFLAVQSGKARQKKKKREQK
jgi:hypothetical protein